MRVMRWWAQAIDRGVMMAVMCWIAGGAVTVIWMFVAMGPLTFLQFVSMGLVIVLAFTTPFWVKAGLMALVSLGSRETWEACAANAENGGQNADLWGGRFRRGWSRWLYGFQRGVVEWFVLRPALPVGDMDIPRVEGDAWPDDAYLRTYGRRWMVQSATMFALLALIAGFNTVRYLFGHDADLSRYPIDLLTAIGFSVPSFGVAFCVCSVAIGRYAVTRMVVKRLGKMAEGSSSWGVGR